MSNYNITPKSYTVSTVMTPRYARAAAKAPRASPVPTKVAAPTTPYVKETGTLQRSKTGRFLPAKATPVDPLIAEITPRKMTKNGLMKEFKLKSTRTDVSAAVEADKLKPFADVEPSMVNIINTEFKRQRALAVDFVAKVDLIDMITGEIRPNAGKRLGYSLYNNKSVATKVKEMINDMIGALLNWGSDRGSSLALHKIHGFKLRTAKLNPVLGGSYRPTPAWVAKTKATINVVNKADNKCFQWAILSALFLQPENPGRVSKYQTIISEAVDGKPLYNGRALDFSQLEFPFDTTDANISAFEDLNQITLFIYVVYGDSAALHPLYVSDRAFPTRVRLLMLADDPKAKEQTTPHFISVVNWSRLMFKFNGHQHANHICDKCLSNFETEERLNDHMDRCKTDGKAPAMIVMPPRGASTKFDKYEKTLPVRYYICSDFEASMRPTNKVITNATTKLAKHAPNSFCNVICDAGYIRPLGVARGADRPQREYFAPTKIRPVVAQDIDGLATIKAFWRQLQSDATLIMRKYALLDVAVINEEEKVYAKCCFCGVDNIRCNTFRHNGEAFGLACDDCRDATAPKVKNRYIPCIFHNFRGYDCKLIMSSFNLSDPDLAAIILPNSVSAIPNNLEKYMTVSVKIKTLDNTIAVIRFIDSFQFMPLSLSKVAKSLTDADYHNLTRYFGVNTSLMRRKGVYPYEYIDTETAVAKFAGGMPPIEAFYNKLSGCGIKPKKYDYALEVYRTLGLKNFGEYHDVYLITDVLILADIFANFITLSYREYKVDPLRFYTSPGLAYQAMLKLSNVKLQLLHDVDMYRMIESGIKGGISMISHRDATANTPTIGEIKAAVDAGLYDKGTKMTPEVINRWRQANITASCDTTKPLSSIVYLDMNALYAGAMSLWPLPYGGFEWSNVDLDTILATPTDSPIGYIVECDIVYPQELHDLHNEYPLLPEKLVVADTMLSPYAQELKRDLKIASDKTPKLVPNLMNKSKYVINYHYLKFAIAHGLVCTKVHRLIKFEQSKWLESFITLNSRLRQAGKTNFEKDFFKLMNNSVYGKFLERSETHISCKFMEENAATRCLTQYRKAEYRIINSNLVACLKPKLKAVLDRPIYIGASILDISKTMMGEFHYDYIKPKYDTKAKLLMTDTDSLCYHITTNDVYYDMRQDAVYFDQSEYPEFHPNRDTTNWRVPGKMKNETAKTTIRNFCGLRPKMYSFDTCAGWSKATAKGVAASIRQHESFNVGAFRTVLATKSLKKQKSCSIRSKNMELATLEQEKTTLCAYDNKRWLQPDGISSLAYGHYLIPK